MLKLQWYDLLYQILHVSRPLCSEYSVLFVTVPSSQVNSWVRMHHRINIDYIVYHYAWVQLSKCLKHWLTLLFTRFSIHFDCSLVTYLGMDVEMMWALKCLTLRAIIIEKKTLLHDKKPASGVSQKLISRCTSMQFFGYTTFNKWLQSGHTVNMLYSTVLNLGNYRTNSKWRKYLDTTRQNECWAAPPY